MFHEIVPQISPGPNVIPGQSLTGETPGLLIDWLTLRVPLDDLGPVIREKVHSCLGTVTACDAEGVVKWQKRSLDVDKLRSDSDGLFWSAQGDGKRNYLVVAGSPATLAHGVNVFGSLDILEGAEILRQAASKALDSVLPSLLAHDWQCRRIDITGNYALPDHGSVKQALRALLNCDGVRRKASSDKRKSDSVYWGGNSDLTRGKAYHKGPHLRQLHRRKGLALSLEQFDLADKLLRLEHTRGARWFRRLEQSGRHWSSLGAGELSALFVEFFSPLVSGLEVKNMGRHEIVRQIEVGASVTHQQALQAFATYRNIKADGFEETKASMARATWFRHLQMLRKAGFSDSQLCAGNVIPFQQVRVLLASPVASWADLRAAA